MDRNSGIQHSTPKRRSEGRQGWGVEGEATPGSRQEADWVSGDRTGWHSALSPVVALWSPSISLVAEAALEGFPESTGRSHLDRKRRSVADTCHKLKGPVGKRAGG